MNERGSTHGIGESENVFVSRIPSQAAVDDRCVGVRRVAAAEDQNGACEGSRLNPSLRKWRSSFLDPRLNSFIAVKSEWTYMYTRYIDVSVPPTLHSGTTHRSPQISDEYVGSIRCTENRGKNPFHTILPCTCVFRERPKAQVEVKQYRSKVKSACLVWSWVCSRNSRKRCLY